MNTFDLSFAGRVVRGGRWIISRQKTLRTSTSTGKPCVTLIVQAGAASLDGLNFEFAPGEAAETSREFVAVKELALGGLNRTERGTSGTPDCPSRRRGPGWAVQRAMLLSLGPVRGERVGERRGGRGWVHFGGVVDGSYERAQVSSKQRDGGWETWGFDILGVVRFPRNLIRGVRVAFRRTAVECMFVVEETRSRV